MKKRTRRSARRVSKPARKAVKRHSREGVGRRKPKRAAKAKAKTIRSPKKASRPKKAVRKAKPAARSAKPRASKKTKPTAPRGRRRGEVPRAFEPPSDSRGLGAESAGQSGDTEGLSRAEQADSESVEELVEEGQAFEAGVISGVENAPDADKGGVRTRQVPEDDVPQEYLDKDE
jgi:hypothetical protein